MSDKKSLSDSDLIETRWHYQYINNVLGDFYHNTLNYFSDYLYPRFIFKVVSTYDKAVETITKNSELNREVDMPLLPALILNPSGDFALADANTGARQLWRSPNLAPGFISRLFDPIYQDENVAVTVGFTRLKGEIEFLALLSSFYEYCDVKMMLIQQFGGFDRVIYPFYFDSFIILPSDLYYYNYQNEYTNESYNLNWDLAGATERLIETTNKNERVFPTRTKPIFKLMNMSDGSTKYGGVDKYADWRLAFTVEFEIEVPSFIVLQSDYLMQGVKMNIQTGASYSVNENSNIPTERQIIDNIWESNLNDSSSGIIVLPENSTSSEKNYVLKNRYFHLVTDQESDSTSDILITLPLLILDPDSILLNGPNGILIYGDHYIIINDGADLLIKKQFVNLLPRQILEIYIYEYQDSV
jgi:hypothetical protein